MINELSFMLWITNHGGLIELFNYIKTNIVLLLNKNYWRLNHVELKFKNSNLKIRLYGGYSMIKEILWKQIYNIDEIGEIKVVVDIGANVGIYSLWAATLKYKDSKLYAYEPLKRVYNVLKENIYNNRLDKRIKVYNYGVSNRRGEDKIYIGDASGFTSLKRKSKDFERIKLITLRDIFDDNKLDSIDVLKIDTEGSEYEILSYDPSLLKKIKYIVLEYHSGEDRLKILDLLRKNGFKIKADFGNKNVGNITAKNSF